MLSLLKVKKRPVTLGKDRNRWGGGGVSRTFIQGGLMAFSMYWALSLALGFQTQNDATRWAWGLQWGPIEG